MATPHLRYGIIGCGSMGREHIENLQAMPLTEGGASVTAIADPHAPEPRGRFGQSAGAAARLRRPPRAPRERPLRRHRHRHAQLFHVEIMRDALATKLPILVEKPLVTRVEDGVELVELEAERRRRGSAGIVWVAHEYRYMPPVAEAIRMTHEGAAGRSSS
jgi:predicted dehydrogenase